MTTKLARARPIESRVEFEAGPAANNPGLRAVLRRHAPSATRQRTLEANGIDCGAGPVYEREQLRREQYGSRSAERAGELGEDRQVGVRPTRSSPRTRSGDSAHSFLSHQP